MTAAMATGVTAGFWELEDLPGAAGFNQMTFSFDALSRSDAETMACWQYEGEYSTYDIAVNQRALITEYMLDSKNRFFGVYRNGEFIGFCSLGKDGQVCGGSYDEPALDIGAG